MRVRFGDLGRSLLVIAAASLLASCSGGGGGPDETRIFFGINGDGNCARVVVDVDLAGTEIEPLRNEAGGLDCALSAVLDHGCDVEFADNGQSIRATISGCTVEAVSSLFDCGFERAELA